MDGYHMTVHWEHAPAVAEGFPSIMLTRSIYIVDRNRLQQGAGTEETNGLDPLDEKLRAFLQAYAEEGVKMVGK